MSVKITKLTWSNVHALDGLLPKLPSVENLTSTTATFTSAEAGLADLREVMIHLPGRGHPKASLHAVVRKLQAELVPATDAEVERLFAQADAGDTGAREALEAVQMPRPTAYRLTSIQLERLQRGIQ